jgi:hypothetical protein
LTLQEFFNYISDNPTEITVFFLAVPATALIAGWISRGEGHQAPWNYLYAALIFAACIPGIFAITLSVYFFLFERGSIKQVNMLTQVLPILSMFLTLGIVRRNVSYNQIPGFDRISSLMFMIGAIIILMYLLDRTRIFAFVHLPVQYLLFIIVGLLLVIRYGMKQVIS